MQGRISPRSNLLRCRQFWLSSSSLAGSSIGNCREHKLGVSDRFDLDQKGACRPSSVWALSYLFVDTTPAGRDCPLFCFRKLYDTGLWRHNSCGSLEAAWTFYSNEWSAEVRLVDSVHLCRTAEGLGPYHSRYKRQMTSACGRGHSSRQASFQFSIMCSTSWRCSSDR